MPLLFNDDVILSFASPSGDEEPLYRNGQADELIYVAKGGGTLRSQLGDLPVRGGDYVVIPGESCISGTSRPAPCNC